MRALCFAILGLALLCASVGAGEQATLDITAETQSMKMIGMPDLSELMAGIDPSLLAGLPSMVNIPGMAPQRFFRANLTSPGVAPENAVATLAVPAGLGLGPVLHLEIWRPEPQTEGQVGPVTVPQFTIKQYWGSSPTVRAGQPHVITTAALTAAQQRAMQAAASGTAVQGIIAAAESTTAHWPTSTEGGQVGPNARLPGHYALTTNYVGGAAFDVAEPPAFLGALELVSPPLEQQPDLNAALTLRWKHTPGVLGYHAQITGMEGDNVVILWSSSEVGPNAPIPDFLTNAEIARLVESRTLMAPDRTEVIVPAGIFASCQMATLMLTGYGPGLAVQGDPVLSRFQTKTTLVVPLLGTMADEAMGG